MPWTELHYAAHDGDASKVLALLAEDASLLDTRETEQGRSALHTASGAGRAKVVGILVAAGAAPDTTRDASDHTALHYACEQGHAQVVQLLMTLGASPNVKAVDNEVPIHTAAVNGHTEIVKMLIAAGADPLAKTLSDGATAGDLAGEAGHALIKRHLELHNQRAKVSALAKKQQQQQHKVDGFTTSAAPGGAAASPASPTSSSWQRNGNKKKASAGSHALAPAPAQAPARGRGTQGTWSNSLAIAHHEHQHGDRSFHVGKSEQSTRTNEKYERLDRSEDISKEDQVKAKLAGEFGYGHLEKEFNRRLDGNHDHAVSYEEFRHVVKRCVKLSDAEVNVMIKHLDADMDGHVSVKEFLRWMSTHRTRHDVEKTDRALHAKLNQPWQQSQANGDSTWRASVQHGGHDRSRASTGARARKHGRRKRSPGRRRRQPGAVPGASTQAHMAATMSSSRKTHVGSRSSPRSSLSPSPSLSPREQHHQHRRELSSSNGSGGTTAYGLGPSLLHQSRVNWARPPSPGRASRAHLSASSSSSSSSSVVPVARRRRGAARGSMAERGMSALGAFGSSATTGRFHVPRHQQDDDNDDDDESGGLPRRSQSAPKTRPGGRGFAYSYPNRNFAETSAPFHMNGGASASAGAMQNRIGGEHQPSDSPSEVPTWAQVEALQKQLHWASVQSSRTIAGLRQENEDLRTALASKQRLHEATVARIQNAGIREVERVQRNLDAANSEVEQRVEALVAPLREQVLRTRTALEVASREGSPQVRHALRSSSRNLSGSSAGTLDSIGFAAVPYSSDMPSTPTHSPPMRGVGFRAQPYDAYIDLDLDAPASVQR